MSPPQMVAEASSHRHASASASARSRHDSASARRLSNRSHSRCERRGTRSRQLSLNDSDGSSALTQVKLVRDSTRGWLAGNKEGLFQIRLEGSPTDNVYIAFVGA
eukprot:5252897-Prymnesium_polylepis.1